MSFYKNSIYRGENVITEIIFSDCYRTFLLCAFPIILAFAMRNGAVAKVDEQSLLEQQLFFCV